MQAGIALSGAEGYSVQTVQTSGLGAERALSGGYDLVVLDVMLPEMDGFEVLRRIRTKSSTPVLMLTARGDDLDRILGLEMGLTITCQNHSIPANSPHAFVPSCAGQTQRTAALPSLRLLPFESAISN